MESNLTPQIIRHYYPGDNGNLLEKYFQLDGLIEGEYKLYYENAQLKIICNYVNGLINGEFKQYHQNGRLWLICNYLNDKIDGEYKIYHPNGDLHSHIIYSHGRIINTIK